MEDTESPPPRDEPTVLEEAKAKEESTLDSVARVLTTESKNFIDKKSEEKNNNDSLSTTKDDTALLASDHMKQAATSPGEESVKTSENTVDTARTEETADPIFDPNEPLLSDIDDEELISALKSLQVDEEDSDFYNQDESFDPLPLEEEGVLEELQVDPEDQELLPLQDFSNVFEEEAQVGDTVAALEDNLNHLSITQDQPEMDEHNEEFPWYFLCRPCQPEMEDPMSIHMRQFQALSEEEQLQLSLLAMADNDHILDGGTDNEYTEEEQVYEESFQTYIVSRRREAVEAAISYTRAFGTGLYQPPLEKENPINERSCFGHKETIYCVHFSECGKFLASASQDATIRVWHVTSNALLSTLTGHDKDYECLRTAW